MSDDSDGEGFYDDPFEEASDGDDSCGDPFADEEDDDGCLGLCGGPSDEEGDDDSNGEEMYEVPCCFDDDDDDGSDQEDLCVSPCEDCDDDRESEEALPDDDDDDDDDDGESEEALPDDDDDVEGEELYDEEGNGGEVVDDPCDEDEEEGDGEAQDLCEDPSCNDDEESELVVFCVSGFSVAHGSHISDSVQDDSSSEEEEEDDELVPIALPTRTTPAPWPVRILLHTDSYDDIDSDSDDTDYNVDEYELHRLPASRTVVESLPEATVSEEEAVYGCAVCKDVFPSGQRVVWLSCKHYFHGDCIRPWLAIRSTCPMCRYQLPTDDAESRQAWQSSVLVPVALPLARQGEAQQNTLGLTQPSEPNCCHVLFSVLCTALYQWLITLPFGSGGRDGGHGHGGGATAGAGDARD